MHCFFAPPLYLIQIYRIEETLQKRKNTVLFTNKVEARKNPLRNYHMTKCLKLGIDAEYFKRVFTLLLSMGQLLCSLDDGSTIWPFQLFVIK